MPYRRPLETAPRLHYPHSCKVQAASSRAQHECWTAALPSAEAEMSAAVDAAAQWTPRTPLEALASVCICDEEDEDDYASDAWTAARSTRVAKTAKVQGAERVRVAGDAVVRGGAEIRGDAGPVGIGRYVDVGPRAIVHGGASVGSHSLLQADAIILTLRWRRVRYWEGAVIGSKRCSRTTASSRPARSCRIIVSWRPSPSSRARRAGCWARCLPLRRTSGAAWLSSARRGGARRSSGRANVMCNSVLAM